ncbi:estrogen sulfotransferase-like [Cimex lectularius]|uniref:Sulfotransferase domain-containing protein n=1 Tax=Cimex lectularius TaxID=79782 RepID=A0A8I6SMF7_CIMLE|nr:estrogen sulfotransferase-like [Cimex lectularius]
MAYPEVISVENSVREELLADHQGEKTDWVQVGPKKYLLPSKCKTEMKIFLDIKTRPDDVWISTFPRTGRNSSTGTTVTQEMVWLLMNNCDFEKAKGLNLFVRSPFLELDLFFHEETKNKLLEENADNEENRIIIENMSKPVFETIDDMDSPRVIKTHFPPSLLPLDLEETGAKVIYLARNPMDVVLSFYHLTRLWRTSDYVNTFQQFCRQFKEGLVPWAPFWEHVQEGWERRNNRNYIFIFYEDMVKDMTATIRKLMEFLEVEYDEETIAKLADHLNINNFKMNPSVNFESLRNVGIFSKDEQSFIRQGNERGNKNEFTEEMKESFRQWINENYENTDLRFPSKH